MIVNKPQMGFNTWNTFGPNVSEEVVLAMADLIVEKGLDKLGYEYVVIDDCWAKRERENGILVADPVKFPHGIKYVADYIHSKGLKFGIYSCAGTMTCAGYPSSFSYEYVDAKTFAEWGVDFLKYDYCHKPFSTRGEYLYRRMGLALANCGRDILFSACSWGADETHQWIRTTGASMWRSTTDIVDAWASIKDLICTQRKILPYGGKNCYNDMDMLIVGMNARGLVGLKGCTEEEYKTHFGVWCLLASPLMIGVDLRAIDESAEKILTNKMLIEINQDELGAQAYEIAPWDDARYMIVRHLSNGDIALGFVNLSDADIDMWTTFDALSLPENCGKTFKAIDVFTGEEDKSVINNTFKALMKPHACKIWRLKIVDKQ